MLRHALAALTYRLDKVVFHAPPGFGEFDAGSGVRTPVQILSHMSDVLIWATGRISGAARQPHTPGSWDQEIVRFRYVVQTLHLTLLDWNNPEAGTALKLPFTDAITHTGQLAMLIRMAGGSIPPENFFEAVIAAPERDEIE